MRQKNGASLKKFNAVTSQLVKFRCNWAILCFDSDKRFQANKEIQLIRYLGIRKTDTGGKLYVFVVNGQQKEIKAVDLKLHPGCLAVLPASVKEQIEKDRQWLSKVN